MVLTTTPESPAHDPAELLIEEARKRQRRRRWLIVGLVAAAIVIAIAVRWAGDSSGSTGRHPAVPEASGLAAPATRTYTECPATHNPKTGRGDGLPPKGYTDESYVHRASRSRPMLDAQFPGITDVEVIPRNGQVWSYDSTGQVLVEQVADFELEVRLQSASDCPGNPWSWGGVPLRFVSPT